MGDLGDLNAINIYTMETFVKNFYVEPGIIVQQRIKEDPIIISLREANFFRPNRQSLITVDQQIKSKYTENQYDICFNYIQLVLYFKNELLEISPQSKNGLMRLTISILLGNQIFEQIFENKLKTSKRKRAAPFLGMYNGPLYMPKSDLKFKFYILRPTSKSHILSSISGDTPEPLKSILRITKNSEALDHASWRCNHKIKNF